jgi:predicted aspartyl protease
MTNGVFNRRGLLALVGLAFAPRAFAQAAPLRMPMRVTKGKIFIDVTLNGRPVEAMVDSGASYSGVDLALAALLGIEARGRRVALRHVHGSSSGRWAEGVILSVGGVARTRPMLVTDFSLLTASVLHPITVLLGADFLAAYVAEFDFEAGSLTLHARTGFTPPQDARLLPLTRPRGLAGEGTPMTAPIVVEGTTLQALVDTGSQSPLIVSPSVARRLKLLSGRRVSTSPIGGIGGTATGRITSLKGLALGRQAFLDVPVQVTARDLSRVDANLGLEVLSRFRLWLDLGGGRMWLAPRAGQPPFQRNLIGFFGLPDGDEAIRVTFVAEDSPADAAGLRDGDVITRIDGKPANVAQQALADAPAGTRLALTLASGQTRNLTLAPYY